MHAFVHADRVMMYSVFYTLEANSLCATLGLCYCAARKGSQKGKEKSDKKLLFVFVTFFRELQYAFSLCDAVVLYHISVLMQPHSR